MKLLLSSFAFLVGCAGAPTADVTGPVEPRDSASAQLPDSDAVVTPPSPAALIVENRKLFVSDGASCDAWAVEVPNIIDEDRGRLRRPASAGELAVVVEFERQGGDLVLESPCFGDKKGPCLGCELLAKPPADVSLRAFARRDECEERRTESAAGLRGCVAALAPSSREHVRRIVDGTLRDEFVTRVSAVPVVSQTRGGGCASLFVRKSGKRLFLDWDASEYPEEVTTRANGIVSIEEVVERNPRYRPRGPGGIGMGCCGGEAYQVLAIDQSAATLRTVPHTPREQPRLVELRFADCPR